MPLNEWSVLELMDALLQYFNSKYSVIDEDQHAKDVLLLV